MQRKHVLSLALIVVLVFLGVGCSSDDKDDGGNGDEVLAAADVAQVRVACMFYDFADVRVDGEPFLDDMVYPYISDYHPLSAGSHTLSIVATGDEAESEASIDLDLEADHSYLVVSYGNVAQQTDHALMVLDETDMLAQMAADRAPFIFLHLVTGAPGLDGYVNDELLMENLTFGQVGKMTAPVGEFAVKITPTGVPDMAVYEDTYNGLPHTYSVAVMIGAVVDPNLYITVYSTLKLLDFFNQLAAVGGYYDTLQKMLDTSNVKDELAGDGPFTVFAPWDSIFMDVPSRDLDPQQSDPEKIADVLRYHIVPENLPPYLLYHRTEVPTLQGTPLVVSIEEPSNTNRPHLWLNDSIRVRQAYRVSNGVLYELEGLLLPPSAE